MLKVLIDHCNHIHMGLCFLLEFLIIGTFIVFCILEMNFIPRKQTVHARA